MAFLKITNPMAVTINEVVGVLEKYQDIKSNLMKIENSEEIHVEMVSEIKNSMENFKWKATPRELTKWKVEHLSLIEELYH